MPTPDAPTREETEAALADMARRLLGAAEVVERRALAYLDAPETLPPDLERLYVTGGLLADFVADLAGARAALMVMDEAGGDPLIRATIARAAVGTLNADRGAPNN